MKPPVEMLIEEYRNSLYAAAFNVCKNAQDAEDVVQDTSFSTGRRKKSLKQSSIYARG